MLEARKKSLIFLERKHNETKPHGARKKQKAKQNISFFSRRNFPLSSFSLGFTYDTAEQRAPVEHEKTLRPVSMWFHNTKLYLLRQAKA
jgi:hypothetical protein